MWGLGQTLEEVKSVVGGALGLDLAFFFFFFSSEAAELSHSEGASVCLNELGLLMGRFSPGERSSSIEERIQGLESKDLDLSLGISWLYDSG